MLEIILVILVLLWITGNLHFTGMTIPDYILFYLNGRPITLINLLIFLAIVWAIGILPSPIREISGVLLILWVLTLLGVLVVYGLSNLLIIAIIIGIVLALLKS